jgi:CheY-like chemotaxis protein
MTDTGCGMDAETLSHAFEPFFTTKEIGKGTGLGLATVYGIVRQSGGYVALASAPGEGTTLRIFMPRCDDLPTASGLLSAVVSRRGAETILVVEDEPSVRALVRTILARQGYRVLVADNAEAALGVASREANPIHLLLTDLVMPGMSGRDLASRMAVLRPSIRIVLTSGYAAQSLDGFPDRDAFAFLAKPFTERTLTAKIREVLDGPRA